MRRNMQNIIFPLYLSDEQLQEMGKEGSQKLLDELVQARLLELSELTPFGKKTYLLPEKKQTPDNKNRFMHAFSIIFPAKFREEYFGDLLEEVSKMEKEAYSPVTIWLTIIGRFLIGFIVLLKVKFADIVPTKRTED